MSSASFTVCATCATCASFTLWHVLKIARTSLGVIVTRAKFDEIGDKHHDAVWDRAARWQHPSAQTWGLRWRNGGEVFGVVKGAVAGRRCSWRLASIHIERD